MSVGEPVVMASNGGCLPGFVRNNPWVKNDRMFSKRAAHQTTSSSLEQHSLDFEQVFSSKRQRPVRKGSADSSSGIDSVGGTIAASDASETTTTSAASPSEAVEYGPGIVKRLRDKFSSFLQHSETPNFARNKRSASVDDLIDSRPPRHTIDAFATETATADGHSRSTLTVNDSPTPTMTNGGAPGLLAVDLKQFPSMIYGEDGDVPATPPIALIRSRFEHNSPAILSHKAPPPILDSAQSRTNGNNAPTPEFVRKAQQLRKTRKLQPELHRSHSSSESSEQTSTDQRYQLYPVVTKQLRDEVEERGALAPTPDIREDQQQQQLADLMPASASNNITTGADVSTVAKTQAKPRRFTPSSFIPAATPTSEVGLTEMQRLLNKFETMRGERQKQQTDEPETSTVLDSTFVIEEHQESDSAATVGDASSSKLSSSKPRQSLTSKYLQQKRASFDSDADVSQESVKAESAEDGQSSPKRMLADFSRESFMRGSGELSDSDESVDSDDSAAAGTKRQGSYSFDSDSHHEPVTSAHHPGADPYPPEIEVIDESSNQHLTAGDGNQIRHSLISLVAEEDLPELMDAMREDVDASRLIVISEPIPCHVKSVLSPSPHLLTSSPNRRKGSISFVLEPPRGYAYVEETHAETTGVWEPGVEISHEQYGAICEAERNEYVERKMLQLERESRRRAQMLLDDIPSAADGLPPTAIVQNGGLVNFMPSHLSDQEYTLGVTNSWSYGQQQQAAAAVETDKPTTTAAATDPPSFTDAERIAADLLF